jgi:hypothetical protein
MKQWISKAFILSIALSLLSSCQRKPQETSIPNGSASNDVMLPSSQTPKIKTPDLVFQQWKAVTSQKLIPPNVKADKRLRIKVSFGIDGSRLDQFRSEGSYVVGVVLGVTNLSKSKITYRDSGVHLLTSHGRDLSVKDMRQSGKGDFEIGPRKYSSGNGALFVLDATDRATKLVYDDGKSHFAWRIEERPKP